MDEEKLKIAIINSTNYKEVLNNLKLRAAGSNYARLKQFINKYKLDINHFNKEKQLIGLKKFCKKRQIPLDSILVENSSYNRGHLKNRLYKMNIKQRICELCGQDENWNGKKMSLILDHINGIHNDNRLENLQIICPNCNATLNTFAGKNAKKKSKTPKQKIFINKKTKIKWPPKEELEKIIWEIPTIQLAKKLGVSDVAIAKHCKKFNIMKPPKGYWQKLKYS